MPKLYHITPYLSIPKIKKRGIEKLNATKITIKKVIFLYNIFTKKNKKGNITMPSIPNNSRNFNYLSKDEYI